MHALIDRKIFRDAVGVSWLSKIPPQSSLNQWQVIGGVAVNFVGADINENGIRTMAACVLQKIQRSRRVNIEIVERAVSCQIVTGLRGGVNDQLETRRSKQVPDGLAIANVHRKMPKSTASRFE